MYTGNIYVFTAYDWIDTYFYRTIIYDEYEINSGYVVHRHMRWRQKIGQVA